MAMHFVMRAPDALCAAPDEHVPVPNGRCPRVRARLVVAGSPAASRAAAGLGCALCILYEWDMSCVRAVPFVVSRRAQYVN